MSTDCFECKKRCEKYILVGGILKNFGNLPLFLLLFCITVSVYYSVQQFCELKPNENKQDKSIKLKQIKKAQYKLN